jgi:hypothetical protein
MGGSSQEKKQDKLISRPALLLPAFLFVKFTLFKGIIHKILDTITYLNLSN